MYGGAALSVFLLLFALNNYVGNSDTTIRSDGIGYYDALPSLFIHHDFIRKDSTIEAHPALYERIKSYKDIYVPAGKAFVDKYSIGTAFLQAPFFLYTYYVVMEADPAATGYEPAFQKSVFHAAITYLFLALVLFTAFLHARGFGWFGILTGQLAMTLATGIVNYVSYEASFSHMYSLFAITGMLLYATKYFQKGRATSFYAAAFFLGLVVLIRPVNLLVVAALPMLADSGKSFLDGIRNLFLKPKYYVGFVIAVALVFVQLLAWYYQTGSYLIYTYQGEQGFDFSNPQLINILFSFKKGLFIYTPVLLLIFPGIIYWIKDKHYWTAASWGLFFLVLTYVLASWWSWFYGCSFGLRAYIEFYPLLILPVVYLVDKSGVIIRAMILVVIALLAWLNLIQSYQYKEYILDWINMDQGKYLRIFGRTEPRYVGYFFRKEFNEESYETVATIDIPDGFAAYELPLMVSQPHSVIRLIAESDFPETADDAVQLRLSDKDQQERYKHQIPLLHMADGAWGTNQTGRYQFELGDLNSTDSLTLIVKREHGTQVKLNHVQVQLLVPKTN